MVCMPTDKFIHCIYVTLCALLDVFDALFNVHCQWQIGGWTKEMKQKEILSCRVVSSLENLSELYILTISPGTIQDFKPCCG